MFVKRHSTEYDIVIEDFAPWNPVFSKYLTKKPVVLHVNHREGRGIIKRWCIFGLPFFLIEAIYPRLFAHVTALSEWTKRKINRPDALVLPAGISSMPDIEGASEAEPPYIVYVGRLHIKNKGLDTLLFAMRKVKAQLVIVGRGKDEDALKGMVKRLELKDIEFAGFLGEEEKLKTIIRARLFVLPSRFEGWGIVLLEAAACGRPVIVSGIPELSFAVDGGFGLSFKTGDAEDLASKINSLLGSDALRADMSAKAREYVKDYTWDRIAVEYEKYLKGVLEE